MKNSRDLKTQVKFGTGRRGVSLPKGGMGKTQIQKLEVLRVNEGLDDLKEISKLINGSWLREFASHNWQEGSIKLSKYSKITIRTGEGAKAHSKFDLKEKVGRDLLALGSEIIGKIRKGVFDKITPDKDTSWLREMSQDQKATLKDKTESCLILIQQNPVVYFKELEILQGILENASNKTGFLKMIDTITSLVLQDGVFPRSRNLYYLHSNPRLAPLFQVQGEEAIVSLSMFEFVQLYFEHLLKEWYLSFTSTLLKMLDDTLWTIRKKIVTVIFHLSTSVSEQRYTLINSIVHKFGDKQDKVASHSAFLMGEVVRTKSDYEMLILIINIFSDHISRNLDSLYKLLNAKKKNEIDSSNKVVFRLVYRLILFISEIKLSKNYNYFSLPASNSSRPSFGFGGSTQFPPPVTILRLCLSTLKVIVESNSWSSQAKGNSNRSVNHSPVPKESLYRLLRVTLNCINRSLPYAEAQIKIINEKSTNQLLQEFETLYIPKLYYLCHNVECGSIRIVILGVLYRISKILNILSDRFFRLLYSQLLYKPIYSSKNKKLLVFLIWRIINDEETNYKVSISLLKRSIQISAHCHDPAMLICFLVILVNLIRYNEYKKGGETKVSGYEGDEYSKNKKKKGRKNGNKRSRSQTDLELDSENETKGENIEAKSMKFLSNTIKELILESEYTLNNDEEENIVDVMLEEDICSNFNENLGNCTSGKEKNGEYLNNKEVKSRETSVGYDFQKRDPKHANGDNSHFWEFELLKSYFHPLVVELVHKSLILCDNRVDRTEHQGILSSLERFLDNFRLNSQLTTKSNENDPITKIFKISSLSLFMQILSYNPVDLNLVLLRHSGSNTQENKRITSFNKWNNKSIPSYLDFYKLYFEDPLVKSIDRFNKMDGFEKDTGDLDDENFEIDYDETSGKMIKRNYKIKDSEGIMVDSLIDDLSKGGDNEDQTDDGFEDDDDIDLLDGVNMDDFEELNEVDCFDDFGDFEEYEPNNHLGEEENEAEDDGFEVNEEKNLGKGIKRKGRKGRAISGPETKRNKSNKRELSNTVTYIDADEMEEYLE
ncbi:CBF/Mak21 family protein [Cryptosporidium felis]|nr:CBF/Mak21 family protein [Cryptosporidium felis]